MLTDMLDIESAEILIIDDEEINLEILEETLEINGFSNLIRFTSPEDAVKYYEHTPPDLVLLDINMPILNGFDVMQKFKSINHTLQPPVLVITAQHDKATHLKALESGARDFLIKPFDSQEVTRRVRNFLEMHLAHKENLQYSIGLEHIVEQRTKELKSTQLEIIEHLGLAAEYRDNETAAHTIRVGLFCQALGKQLGLKPKDAEQLRMAAPLHDIGKIGIADNILLKPGKLDAQEWEQMKMHSEFGYNILKDSTCNLLKNAGIIALTHHEKWDGSGYPSGLKREDIHIYGRITAIADVFDALTMSRPYKKAWSIEKSVALINEESGKHFDPSIVDAFNTILDELLIIRDNNAD